MESNIAYGPEDPVYRRSPAQPPLDERAVRALYGVSRKTGYKWIERYLQRGPQGLEERSRRPQRCPNQTSEEVVAALLELRRRHPSWGARKLLAILEQRRPSWVLPHRSTVCDILSRHGMVAKKRQRTPAGDRRARVTRRLAPVVVGVEMNDHTPR